MGLYLSVLLLANWNLTAENPGLNAQWVSQLDYLFANNLGQIIYSFWGSVSSSVNEANINHLINYKNQSLQNKYKINGS